MSSHQFVPYGIPSKDHIWSTHIEGLYFIIRPSYSDDRGFFTEPINIPTFEEVTGESFQARQMNYSYSKQGVMRGFHAEDWNKVVTVVDGNAYAVVADIRPESATFGDSVAFWLNATSTYPGSIYISRGLANAFCVVDGPVRYLYLVDKVYAERDPSGDAAINLFDPDLAISWPIIQDRAMISDRDRQAVNLRELFPDKFDPA